MAADPDEQTAIQGLTADVRDQDDLERDITFQANAALQEQEDKKDQTRIQKLEASKTKLEAKRDQENQKMRVHANNPYQTRKIRIELDKLDTEIARVISDIDDFKARIEKRHEEAAVAAKQDQSKVKSKRLPGESQHDYLVRTGKITPFANVGGPRPQGFEGDLADAFIDAEEAAAEGEMDQEEKDEPTSHQVLRRPGFAEASEEPSITEEEFSLRPRKKRKTHRDGDESDDFQPTPVSEGSSPAPTVTPESDSEEDRSRRRKDSKKQKSKAAEAGPLRIDLSHIDDGNEGQFKMRYSDWVRRRSKARRQRRRAAQPGAEDSGDEEEWSKPNPDHDDFVVSEGLKVPGDISPSLFSYQKIGVQWLAELYSQRVGGIVGDEMGLGKTIQVIAFVAALHHSKKLDRPVVVVAPATVLRQWVNEFHKWWPALRVSILHASGSGMLNTREDDDDLDDARYSSRSKSGRQIVDRVAKKGGVLVTTYQGLQTYADEILHVEWAYAVLDEGHKIRNPNAEITVACKELNTPNRIILSGTPVQNNLSELWSLFDFIYPMRLGTLVNFRTQFEIPIRQGGYANASNLQILTAEKCAETLKEAISQYLLQRLKVDVAADLPEKTEQVLFCKLTKPQLDAYQTFLNSDECAAILNRRRQSLYGIDILRKICNHPDILDQRLATKAGYEWGAPDKSGKLQVVQALLQMWKKNGHKTLLFSQSKQMLNILQSFIGSLGNITYVRMDGETPVDRRQALIDRFNNDPDIDVFILTTRTGGLGINLTGADRIIIYDPDWNPSTDMQARERAWRLGQTKPVSIYRLMTTGTIEEKIYHRQVFKQFMTNKVLKDPKQRVSFDLTDLYDLFTLGNPKDKQGNVDRSRIFDGAEVDMNEHEKHSQDQAATSASASKLVPISDVSNGEVEAAGSAKNGGGAVGGGGGSRGDSRSRKDEATNEVNDVQKFSGVANMEEFQEQKDIHDEKRMVEGIFSRQVESAYDHEAIMSGKKKPQADLRMNLDEANSVARTAAQHLSRSEREARNVQPGEVTWTGTYGTAGRPGAGRRRGGASAAVGPSSAGIMAGLANRQGIAGPNDSGGGVRSGSGTPSGGGGGRNLKKKDFAENIVLFLKRQGGKAPSKMLVDHFSPLCPGPRQTEDFKAALDEVAKLTKSGGPGRGMWSLKTGY